GNIIWKTVLPNPQVPKAFCSVVQTGDGEYIAAGFTGHLYDSSKQVLIVKISTTGSVIWQKEYGGSGEDLAYSVIRCKSGGYLITGTTTSNDGNITGNHGSYDFLVMRIDEDGNLLWQKCFGGSGIEFGRSVIETPDHDFLFCGSSQSTDGDVTANSGVGGGWLFKTDNSGNIIWQKNYGGFSSVGNGTIARFNNLSLDASGNIYAAGYEESTKLGSDSTWITSNIWVIKVKSSGELIWSKVYGGPGFEEAMDISRSFTGSVLITGHTSSRDGDFGGIAGAYVRTFLLNISDDGNILDKKIFQSNEFEGGFSFFQTKDEEYVLIGSSVQYQGMLIKLGAANYIKGNLFLDENSNSVKDPTEKVFNNALVKIKKQDVEMMSASPYNGNFEMPVDTGTYVTTVQLFNPYYTVAPLLKSNSFNSYHNTDSFSFAIQPIPNKQDLIVHFIPVSPARPGFKAQYVLNYKNIGTTTIANGSVKLVKDNRTTFSVSLPFPASIVADTITWNYTNLKPLDSVAIGIEMQLVAPPVLNNSDTLRYRAIVLPVTGDLTPANDTSSLRQLVQGSYDPNDKQESFAGRMPLRIIQDGAYINYMIRFQNTGNDTAFTVRLMDTLENKLDWGSFEMIGSSHKYTLTIKGGNKLQWVFNDIKLPDSTTNLTRSIGFVAFRIKPKNTVATSDVIKNKASIYFDYNLPIVTNSADITITNEIVTAVREIQNDEMKLQFGPNPSSGFSNLMITGKLKGKFELRIINSSGSVISHQTITRNSITETNNVPVNLEKFSSGIYYIQLQQ
ncbi:MAG: T9SS type A sorting domain-containing protein, partial [Chitinophagaceae bacterium]|nr:T9SS type A sorting domain-containing protein [Chitinophagaceae bacterium]